MPNPEHGGTWGILGGAFDPVHRGHLTLATDVIRARDLTGALFVPAYKHPFKGDRAHATYEQRVTMLRLALGSDDRLQVCEIEAQQDLSGYTVDTIRALKETYPEASFRFVIGADLLTQIDQWDRPDQLLHETKILAGARPGYHLTLNRHLPAERIEFVPTDTPDISSTELRAMIHRGEPRPMLAKWIPGAVLDYIEKEQLYQ